MAVLRSRAITDSPQGQPGPNVMRGQAMVEERVAEARSEGEQAAELQCQSRVKKIEADMAALKKDCDKRVREAEQDWKQLWHESITAVDEATTQLKSLQARALAEAEQDIIAVALGVAQKVLGREVETDPLWMKNIVQDVLTRVPDRNDVTVDMHPDDLAVMQEHLGEVLPAGFRGPSLRPVESVQRGSCQVHSGGTSFDAGVVTAWERLAATLMAATPADAPSGGFGPTVESETTDNDAGEQDDSA